MSIADDMLRMQINLLEMRERQVKKPDKLSLTEVKAILEDLDGSRSELRSGDIKLLDRLLDAQRKGGKVSDTEIDQLNEIWMRLA